MGCLLGFRVLGVYRALGLAVCTTCFSYIFLGGRMSSAGVYELGFRVYEAMGCMYSGVDKYLSSTPKTLVRLRHSSDGRPMRYR